MMRLLAALLLVMATTALAGRTVDLDAPGALEALQKSNPGHFGKLQNLVARTMSRDEASVERIILAAGGSAIHRGHLIRTSYPARAPLSFVLDDVRYVITVTVPDPGFTPKSR